MSSHSGKFIWRPEASAKHLSFGPPPSVDLSCSHPTLPLSYSRNPKVVSSAFMTTPPPPSVQCGSGRVQEGKKGHPKWITTQKIIFLKMCPRPSTDSPWLMLLWPDHDLRSFGVCGVVKAFMFLFLSAYFWEGKNLTFLCFELEQIRDHFSQPPWGYLYGEVASDLL